MKTRKFTREFVDAYIAGDGTVFKVIAEDPLNPTIEEMIKAEKQCKQYENSALYVVMEKLGKSKSVLASNFIIGLNDYKVLDATGSSHEDDTTMKVCVFLPTMLADMLKFDYRSYRYMVFRPNSEDDIYLLKQFIMLTKKHSSSDVRYCGVYLDELEVGKVYYIGYSKIPERNDIFIISHDNIKEQVSKELEKLDRNIEIMEDPSKFIFDYQDGEIKRKADNKEE